MAGRPLSTRSAKIAWAGGLLLLSLLALNALGYHMWRLCDAPPPVSAADGDDEEDHGDGEQQKEADGQECKPRESELDAACDTAESGRMSSANGHAATESAAIAAAIRRSESLIHGAQGAGADGSEGEGGSARDMPAPPTREERSAKRIAAAEMRLRSAVGTLGRLAGGGGAYARVDANDEDAAETSALGETMPRGADHEGPESNTCSSRSEAAYRAGLD